MINQTWIYIIHINRDFKKLIYFDPRNFITITMETTNNTEMSIPWEEIKEPLGYSSTLNDSKKCLCGGIAHRTNHQFTKNIKHFQ